MRVPPSPPFFVSIVIIVIIPYIICAIESFFGPITPNDDDVTCDYQFRVSYVTVTLD